MLYDAQDISQRNPVQKVNLDKVHTHHPVI